MWISARVALVVTAALAAAAPAAAVRRSSPVDAVRAAAVRESRLAAAGSPAACDLMTARGRAFALFVAKFATGSSPASCASAVAAVAEANWHASGISNRQAYLRSMGGLERAIGHGTVTFHGNGATLAYTDVQAAGKASGSLRLLRVGGRWLVDAGGSLGLSAGN